MNTTNGEAYVLLNGEYHKGNVKKVLYDHILVKRVAKAKTLNMQGNFLSLEGVNNKISNTILYNWDIDDDLVQFCVKARLNIIPTNFNIFIWNRLPIQSVLCATTKLNRLHDPKCALCHQNWIACMIQSVLCATTKLNRLHDPKCALCHHKTESPAWSKVCSVPPQNWIACMTQSVLCATTKLNRLHDPKCALCHHKTESPAWPKVCSVPPQNWIACMILSVLCATTKLNRLHDPKCALCHHKTESPAWSKVCSVPPQNWIACMIQSVLCATTKLNRLHDPKCALCHHKTESPAHVLNGCHVLKNFYSARHNRIVDEVFKFVKPLKRRFRFHKDEFINTVITDNDFGKIVCQISS